MYAETENYVLSETTSENIHLNTAIELTAFYNNNICRLKDVVQPDTMYLILTVPMRIWDHRSFELINKLEAEKGNMPCAKVILIAYGTTLRDMRVKISAVKGLLPFYMTPLEDIGLPADKPNRSYLIFTSDGQTASHTLSFEHGSTQYLPEFIRILSEKYCKQAN